MGRTERQGREKATTKLLEDAAAIMERGPVLDKKPSRLNGSFPHPWKLTGRGS